MIPIEYLSKMGGHCVEIQGVEIKVKEVDWETSRSRDSLVGAYIDNMKPALKSGPRVVGVDIIRRLHSRSGTFERESLVLCGGAANCLIVHLPQWASYLSYDKVKAPDAVMEFLEDPNICFVGVTRWPSSLVRESFAYETTVTRGVGAGDLAARVLRNPTLNGRSLAEISWEVGVYYKRPGPAAFVRPMGTETKVEIKVDDRNPAAFTEEQVKAAVNDAYAYYRIGHKLLSSL